MRNSRAVIGFWLVHLFRRPELLREAIAEVLSAPPRPATCAP